MLYPIFEWLTLECIQITNSSIWFSAFIRYECFKFSVQHNGVIFSMNFVWHVSLHPKPPGMLNHFYLWDQKSNRWLIFLYIYIINENMTHDAYKTITMTSLFRLRQNSCWTHEENCMHGIQHLDLPYPL